jgi:hypothetical protein
MEAVYVDMAERIGFARFAPVREATGAMFSARNRAAKPGEAHGAAAISEQEFYSST